MDCPVCGGETGVNGGVKDCETVWRRRKCKDCGYFFFTTDSELPTSKREFNDRYNEYIWNLRHAKKAALLTACERKENGN